MDVNWLSVVLHLVAARFRMPARIVVVLSAWLFHAVMDAPETATSDFAGIDASLRVEQDTPEIQVIQSRDEYVMLGHAVVRVIVQIRVLPRVGGW